MRQPCDNSWRVSNLNTPGYLLLRLMKNTFKLNISSQIIDLSNYQRLINKKRTF